MTGQTSIEQAIESVLARFGVIPSTVIAAPAHTNGTAAAPAVAPTLSAVTGTLTKIAAHFKGANLDTTADKWWNATKDAGELFKGFAVGQSVILTLNDAGRVTMVRAAGTTPPAAPSKPAKPAKQAARTAPAAQPAPAAPAEPLAVTTQGRKLPLQEILSINADGTEVKRCALCKGPTHGKDAHEVVRRNCAIRQYQTATMKAVSLLDTASMRAFLDWLDANEITVGAYNDTGRERIGGKGKPTPPTPPTPPAAKQDVCRPAEAEVAASKAPRKRGSKAPAKAEQTTTGAASAAPTRVGTFEGLVAQHAKQTAGLVKVVSAQLPQCKPAGDWIGSKDAALVAAIVKSQVNDRVRFTLAADGAITAWEILGDVSKETGHKPGVKNSGKQQSAEPKSQGVDPKVAQVRKTKAAERKAATRVEKIAELIPDDATGDQQVITAVELAKMTDAELDAALLARSRKSASKSPAASTVDAIDLSEKDAGWQPITNADGSIRGVTNGKRKRAPKTQANVSTPFCGGCGRRFSMIGGPSKSQPNLCTQCATA